MAKRLELRKAFGIPAEAEVVLFVRRMIWHKGVGELVDAARRVLKERPETVFVLVGPLDQGNPAAISEAMIRSWEKEGVVHYLGVRQDVRDLMAIADILALPSYREGLPRVLVEGAVMGKPLIATDVPSCREVVLDGINGMLISPKDAKALAKALEVLLGNPDLRKRMGQAARQLAVARFSDQKVVDEILEIYARLLEAKGLPIPEGLKVRLTSHQSP